MLRNVLIPTPAGTESRATVKVTKITFILAQKSSELYKNKCKTSHNTRWSSCESRQVYGPVASNPVAKKKGHPGELMAIITALN